jgi:hypothetical protein
MSGYPLRRNPARTAQRVIPTNLVCQLTDIP